MTLFTNTTTEIGSLPIIGSARGVRFNPRSYVTITSLRMKLINPPIAQQTYRLYNEYGTLLAQLNFNASGSGWYSVNLPEPINLYPSLNYILSCDNVGNYATMQHTDTGYTDLQNFIVGAEMVNIWVFKGYTEWASNQPYHPEDIYFAGNWNSPDSNDWFPAFGFDYSYASDNPPSPPILSFSNLSSNGSTLNKRPKIYMAVNDSSNVTEDVQLQVATDVGFSNIIYDVKNANGGFTNLPTPSTSGTVTWTPPADLPIGAIYIRAKAKDIEGWNSGWTTANFVIASPPWSDTIPTDAINFKAVWLNQLATVINNAQLFRGLTATTFSDGTITTAHDMRTAHITERRNALATVLNVNGITPTWTDTAITNSVDRKGLHLNEIRNYCLQT